MTTTKQIKYLHQFLKECKKLRDKNKPYNVSFYNGCYILGVLN